MSVANLILEIDWFLGVDMEYDEYFQLIGTNTTGRYDVTPLFTDSAIFEELRHDLVGGVSGAPTVVCGLEALGFILGSAVAVDLEIGFVPVRKGGKLPYTDDKLLRREFTDYSNTSKTLELRTDAVAQTDRVLLIDDWIETGAQMQAATELVEQAGATVHAITAITADRNDQTEFLFDAYDVYSLG